MDLEKAFIGTILIAICIIPFILTYKSRKKKEKESLKLLTYFAKQHNSSITQHELCGDFVIGIDKTKAFVFFINKIGVKEDAQCIDLADIKNCKIKNKSKTINSKTGSYTITNQLALVLSPSKIKEPDIELKFYDSEKNMQLNDELQTIEKWSKIINELLNDKK